MSFKIENQTLISLNPASDAEVGRLPMANKEAVLAAVKNARAAGLEWSLLSFEQRAEALSLGLRQIVERAEELGHLISAEMGKPLAQAIGEASYSAQHGLDDLIAEAREAVTPKVLSEDKLTTTLNYVPRGVVAVITPWNFPVNLSLNALVPALLTGNSVVYKPSEFTALTGDLLARLLGSGLPDGVLTVVHGDGAVGKALVEAEIDMVAFVGSQATGQRILETQARQLNPAVLEMGGKDAMLVLADAELEAAARYAVSGSLRNSGQVCVSVERIYVEQPIAAAFESRVRELMAEFRVGDPLDERTQMGPLVSVGQRQKVIAQLAEAKAKGATIEGGEIPEGPGSFLTPALATNVTDEMQLMRDETFGPVIAIQRVASAAEALAKANALDYGLGGTVWSQDLVKARTVAARLEAGMIGINRGLGGASGSPFVGNKKSTLGFFGGVDGVRQFTQIRSISEG
ncbi:MAG: aldehyde dehydrogenase [Candidatus Sericytochromatia bacterium]